MRILLILLLLTSLPAAARNKKITGHWSVVSTGDSLLTMEDLVHSGTVTFKRVKPNTRKTYQWAGGLYTGVEFAQDGEFIFYNNVLCSTENSPQTNWGETWEMADAGNIVIKGQKQVYKARILSVSRSKLVLQFIP